MIWRGLPHLALALQVAGAALAQGPGDDFLRVTRAEDLPPALSALVDGLDASRLAAHIRFLADPKRDGRGLGTKGLTTTVHYLGDQLKALGIPPLGTSYYQPVPLRKVLPGSSSLQVRTPTGEFTFQARQNAVFPSIAPGTLSGPVIHVGYGIQEPSLGHDDFRGLDLRGKVVVLHPGLPPGAAWQKPELIEKYAPTRPGDRYDSRLALLEKLGARAVIGLEEHLDRRIADGKESIHPTFLAARGVPAAAEPPLIRVAASAAFLAAIHGGEATGTLTIQGSTQTLRESNVLGRLEGSDPALRQEAILIGAHMDHLGRPQGVLHPGADDNASGVAALLEIARTLARAPRRPRRTILIAFWTGEEEGKFGSGHYTRHPLWPLSATRAYLNLDMIGHPWTPAELKSLTTQAVLQDPKAFLDGLDPSHFAEPGLSSGHRDLGPILRQAGLGTGMSLHLDWTDGRNGGSDYRDFARLNVPFVRFFGDYFPEYHTPGDTPDRLDPDQVKRMARLILATAWLLADR